MQNKEHTFWTFIHEAILHDQPCTLLIVAESAGSSPGRQGFKMAVTEKEMIGSIGGGIMEMKLVEHARSLMHEHPSNSLIKKQIHRKDAARDQSGMICSGEQTVIYVNQLSESIQEVKKILGALNKNELCTLRISCTEKESKFDVEHGEDRGIKYAFEKQGDQNYHYKEQIGFQHKLYIIGGGHCALALSELAAKLNFYIEVIDDRENLNTLEQNIFAHHKEFVTSYEEIEHCLPEGDGVFVVVMTLGYRSDLVVIRHILKKKFKYIGLLGSQSKVRAMWDELISEGYSENELQHIHAPIGIAISSHTPEEIAVSIAAQMIEIKNK